VKIQQAILSAFALISACGLQPSSFAGTTIDVVNRYGYGANLGWMDWTGGTGETATGAVIGEYVCSGYIYSANVGWINLGSGFPADQIQYQNNSATDFGVNQDGLGNLRGYAYGANIGWINFETNGAPKVNLLTGRFSGYAYSANCGWISLSNAVAYVQTDSIQQGELAPDGLPIAWLLTNFGTTNVNADADPDHDGMSNAEEYEAGTDPNNAGSNLRITAFTFGHDGTSAALTWNSVPTRYYYLQKTTNLVTNNWADSGLGLIPPAGSSTSDNFTDSKASIRFYRVEAMRPLMP
jgi:hypothetical protein